MCFLQNFHHQIPTARFIFQHAEVPSGGPRQAAAEEGKEAPKDGDALVAWTKQQALNLVIDAAMRKLDAARKAGSDAKLQEIAAGLKQVADDPYILLGGMAAAGSAENVLYPWVKKALLKAEGKQK